MRAVCAAGEVVKDLEGLGIRQAERAKGDEGDKVKRPPMADCQFRLV